MSVWKITLTEKERLYESREVLETKADTIVEFVQGVRGTLALTFEEGTWAAWLHDLLKPHVSRLVVCDPRKNAPEADDLALGIRDVSKGSGALPARCLAHLGCQGGRSRSR